MVRNYKRKTDRVNWSEEQMKIDSNQKTMIKKAKISKSKAVLTDGVEDSQCPMCDAFLS